MSSSMRPEFVMRPIGVIHTPFTTTAGMPIQPIFSQVGGQVEVFPEYEEGLKDVEEFSHVILIYILHNANGYALHVKPFLDDEERGLFATRHPRRPNPIGLSTVCLLARRGNVLDVAGIDVLDGTPLLDIKPYVPDFDGKSEARTGWYDKRPTGKEGRS